jgi:hypothetical protein
LLFRVCLRLRLRCCESLLEVVMVRGRAVASPEEVIDRHGQTLVQRDDGLVAEHPSRFLDAVKLRA